MKEPTEPTSSSFFKQHPAFMLTVVSGVVLLGLILFHESFLGYYELSSALFPFTLESGGYRTLYLILINKPIWEAIFWIVILIICLILLLLAWLVFISLVVKRVLKTLAYKKWINQDTEHKLRPKKLREVIHRKDILFFSGSSIVGLLFFYVIGMAILGESSAKNLEGKFAYDQIVEVKNSPPLRDVSTILVSETSIAIKLKQGAIKIIPMSEIKSIEYEK